LLSKISLLDAQGIEQVDVKTLWMASLWSPEVKKYMAVFTSEIFEGNIPVALSLLFDKIYPTMN
jgi:hypothetical protein